MGRERLVARRVELGLTQEQLAYRLGVDPRTLRRWESGESIPQPLHRRPLANALDVSTGELADLLAARPAGSPAVTVAALVAVLEQAALTGRRREPALPLLGRAYEALGDLSFDRLAYAEATEHYHQAYEVGVELGDPDLTVGAGSQLADIARRRGRYQAGFRFLAQAGRDIAAASVPTQVRRYQIAARAHAELGDLTAFDAEIGQAEELAEWACAEAPDLAPASPQEVRLERAQGLTVLGRAGEALAIYEAEQVAPTTDRQRGSYLIIRAQALAHGGHLDEGVRMALEGLGLARSYGSARHVSRVQRMHDRLATTLAPSESRLVDLREALAAS
jgi:transcriptional regulator with XRE-family HTH domain